MVQLQQDCSGGCIKLLSVGRDGSSVCREIPSSPAEPIDGGWTFPLELCGIQAAGEYARANWSNSIAATFYCGVISVHLIIKIRIFKKLTGQIIVRAERIFFGDFHFIHWQSLWNPVISITLLKLLVEILDRVLHEFFAVPNHWRFILNKNWIFGILHLRKIFQCLLSGFWSLCKRWKAFYRLLASECWFELLLCLDLAQFYRSCYAQG